MKAKTLAAVLVAAITVSGAASAQEYTLKLGHDQTDGHPYDLGVERFAEGVKEATKGAVEIKIYPAAQLGDSAEQIEGLKLGTQDLALAAFSHASQFCKELGLFGAPFLFRDPEHFAAVFDGPVGDKVDAACQNRYDMSLLSTFTSGYRLLFNGKRPVGGESDLEGLKIRVMGGEADAMTWKVFGAIPSPMPYSEVYSALQAGVIDGAENEPASILANKFYETAPYFTLTRHLVLPMGLFASELAMGKLPAEYRDVLKKEARKAARWQWEFMAERNTSALKEMQDKYDVKVSEIDPSVFQAKGMPIQDQVAEKLDLVSLLGDVRSAK
jgi:tripartite ATP-independent transporter DctP family solute receptor